MSVDGRINCKWPGCDKRVDPRGLRRHEQFCNFKESREALSAQSALISGVMNDDVPAQNQGAADVSPTADNVMDASPINDNDQEHVHFGERSENGSSDGSVASSHYVEDDIRIEYHPHSNKPPLDIKFDDRQSGKEAPIGTVDDLPPVPPKETEPWAPFDTRLDFEFAELMLDCLMNERQKKALINLLKRLKETPTEFTIQSVDHLDKIWQHARGFRGLPIIKKPITVEYQGENHDFDVWARPVRDWCVDLLTKHRLSQKMHWDAERNYKFNGTRFERFYDEPWTGDAWWEKQSLLPVEGKPFFLILYADKSKLSSFGTTQGYPVIARCANLPANIRNGRGVGGGRIVGILPIEKEDAAESGKKGYVNFKRVIWHTSVREILQSAHTSSQLGFQILCDDNIKRLIFIIILILSADFEEQSMMALTRGPTSNYPCTVCLVPKEELTTYSMDFEIRSQTAMHEVVLSACSQRTQQMSEEILIQLGLRDVDNVFWSMGRTDVHDALSWDRLHAYHLGLFGDHLLAHLRELIKPSRNALATMDAQLDLIPPWSGLTHFTSFEKSSEFNDGQKLEDLSKVILFVAYNVISAQEDKEAYHLLKMIRSYIELDMFSSLSVQTESTLNSGHSELLVFESLLQDYSRRFPVTLHKSYSFVKAHTHTHMFRDIRRKGATRNFTTKYNEQEHGPLRLYYRFLTNFKNVNKQLSQIDEARLVSISIRADLIALDEYTKHAAEIAENNDDIRLAAERGGRINGDELTHIFVGSKGDSVTMQRLQSSGNAAFGAFQRRVNETLSLLLNKQIRLPDSHEVVPYQYMRVSFESKVTWQPEQNILRTNPSFHKAPRYDYALVHFDNNICYVAQLLYIFGITINGTTSHLVLIRPMDAMLTNWNQRRDQDLRFTRLRSRALTMAGTKIISVESIIRGCLVIKDFSSRSDDEYLLVPFVDQDMWVRMKDLQLGRNLNI